MERHSLFQHIYTALGVLVAVALCMPLVAQPLAGWGCATEMQAGGLRTQNCSETSADWMGVYRHKERWVPDSLTPVKTLHVNFHMWQRSDGTGNLSDTPQNRARLHTVIDWVNQNYWTNLAQLPPLSYPVQFISSSRIKVVLDSIYFYQDSTDSVFHIIDPAVNS